MLNTFRITAGRCLESLALVRAYSSFESIADCVKYLPKFFPFIGHMPN